MRRLSLWSAGLFLACSVFVSGQRAPAPVTAPPPASADFVVPGPVQPLPPAVSAAVSKLRADLMAAHIAMLSSPAMDGRGLGTHALEAAAEYIAASLAVAGVPPLTEARTKGAAVAAPYFHDVPVREITKPGGHLVLRITRGDAFDEQSFQAGVDVRMPEVAPDVFGAPLVFAGYGIRESKPARDDYRDLDVKGRIIVLLGGVPAGTEWQAKDLVDRYGAPSGRRRFAAKAELARALGARAILAIEGEDFAGILANGESAPASRFFVGYERDEDDLFPVIRVSARAGEMMLRAAGLTVEQAGTAAPRALPGVSAAVTITGDERLVMSRNVVGVLRGSDPKLRDAAVVMGAHFDHLGREGDKYYPGADDNASGTSALLEIARAAAASPTPPRRTLVFVWWTGEEEGHLGSEYYVRHPLWPLERTAAYLNLDMIAHPWKPEEIRQLVADSKLDKGNEFLAKVKTDEFIELGVPERWPFLWPILTEAARGTGLALHLDRTDGKSGGSDYRAFARRNLPFVRFFGNYFDGYHEPTDTADAIDPAQVLRMARLALAAAWLTADR